ncbi:MAG: 2,3-bisphosphoglycerate-dependent phosphoglycerate mutase [Candidatus Nanoperiomorbaceae bacterium]
MSGKLILTRHSESAYNVKGLWTGITNVSLTDKGVADARKLGTLLHDLTFDKIYTSCLKRADETRDNLLAGYVAAGGQFTRTDANTRKTAAINERDYGDYTGLNKWEVKEKVGDEQFQQIRRAFDAQLPNGESLRDVYERAIPWYREIVLPQLLDGQNVLIVAHGNSDRALRKFLEDISDEDVAHVEMDPTKIYIYNVRDDGLGDGAPEMREIETKQSTY